MGVYTRNNKIYLHDYFNGKRERLATGVDVNKQTVKYYERNFDIEFNKLLTKKYGNLQSSISFLDYGSMVLEVTKSYRSVYTQKEIIRIFEKLCVYFGDMDITDIKPTNIMMWQSSCNLASKTISNYRSCLNIIFKSAYNDEIINRNPLESVKPPKPQSVKKRVFYSVEDMQKILKVSDGSLKNLLQVLFFTGMRSGELIGLKWSDIDFGSNMIELKRTIREGQEKESLKSQNKRFIPMFRQTIEALKDQQKYTKLKSDYVFVNCYGNHYSNGEYIRLQFADICKKANVERGTLHDIRRSCNTILKQHGFKTDFILDFMGHKEEYVNRVHYTGKILDDLSKLDYITT
jgi:integrase